MFSVRVFRSAKGQAEARDVLPGVCRWSLSRGIPLVTHATCLRETRGDRAVPECSGAVSKGRCAMKVRAGKRYVFEPVPFDRCNPPFDASPGDVVTVVNLPGCPRANTMGMCHIAKGGQFAGMVCTNSLRPFVPRRKDGTR